VVERSLLGNQPLFHVPEYHLQHPAELLAYAALGVVGGIVSIAFSKGLLALREWFRRLPESTRAVQPALGGLVIGLVLLGVPEVMGVGYDYIDQALNGGLVLETMVVLCVVKMVATIVSYSSGNAGGIFAPSLYIGAMAGGAVGAVVHQLAPLHTADPGAYALVGMGTLFAGIIRAPMTSVFMIFEITQDYQILVPLMVANLLSFIIARRVEPTPLYHALLKQDGVHLPPGHARASAAPWTAGDVMSTNLARVAEDVDLERAHGHPDAADADLFVVGPNERAIGVIRREQLSAAITDGRGGEAVTAIALPLALHAHADQPSDVVLERLAQAGGVLPVVSRDNAQHVLGVVTFPHIMRYMRRRTEERAKDAEQRFG
jgi:CIC family chloride channel protein